MAEVYGAPHGIYCPRCQLALYGYPAVNCRTGHFWIWHHLEGGRLVLEEIPASEAIQE